MARSSITGGERAQAFPSGTDVDALGPSDTTDSGSDVQTDGSRLALSGEDEEGAWPLDHESTSDASGTGERASSDAVPPLADQDILTDRVGDFPGDAMEAAVSIDDPTQVEVGDLAQEEGEVDDDDALDDGEQRPGTGTANGV